MHCAACISEPSANQARTKREPSAGEANRDFLGTIMKFENQQEAAISQNLLLFEIHIKKLKLIKWTNYYVVLRRVRVLRRFTSRKGFTSFYVA